MFQARARGMVAMLVIFVILSASVALAAPPRVENPTAIPYDHFWCYYASSQPVNEVVTVQDQFQAAPVQVTVGAPERFCNPVAKRHGDREFPIVNPDNHLMFYRIGTPEGPTHIVGVRNQFGKKRLRVYEPALYLAVPTKKDPHNPPNDLDHYQCYQVRGQSVNAVVDLKDQFQQGTNLQVTKPVLLCNPTTKVHNGQQFPILHPEAHLVCYATTQVIFSQVVNTENQFRAEQLTITSPDLLCAPSLKRIID